VVTILENDPRAAVATLARPIRAAAELDDPACVKVVRDHRQRALYFSRGRIPFARQWDEQLLHAEPPRFLAHVGIYAYRREFLLELPQLPTSNLEDAEKLEQLRFLEAGCRIRVGMTEHSAAGIDTWEDYRAFVSRVGNC